MKVIEIFKSIDGEGTRAGLPTTFIRLFGCNLRCSYCDTPYSLEGEDYKEMTVDQIIEKCTELGVNSITVTGGEPLFHEGIEDLLAALDRYEFDINVETNGSIDPSNYHKYTHTWYTVDYKCPSSKMGKLMNPNAFESLREEDVLKFVVGCDEDLTAALHMIEDYNPKAHVYFSPVFGYEGSKIVDFMLENKLHDCKVQLQIHKYIWPVDMRGV